MTYKRLLQLLPEPSGWVPSTNRVDTNAYSLLGFRSYDVNGQYTEVAKFFRVKIPQAGWRPLKEAELLTPYDHGAFIQGVSLLFSRQDRYCLQINLGTTVDEQGIQKGDRVWVHMTISWEDYNCYLR